MSELSDPNSQPGHQPFAADDAQPLTPTHRGNVGKGDGRQHRLRTAALEAEVLTGVHETSEQQARRSLLRRLARITAGSLLLLAGILMLVLPGPGWIAIAGGLAVLSRDVAWAARLLEIVR
ncbi:MAG: PGPGW domain-containing protein, partial [Acidimicrobiia bacterium]|nr:PGPGW domain-containing protein [Acidimicrobiia bacterium]